MKPVIIPMPQKCSTPGCKQKAYPQYNGKCEDCAVEAMNETKHQHIIYNLAKDLGYDK